MCLGLPWLSTKTANDRQQPWLPEKKRICYANDAFHHVLLSTNISRVLGDIHLFCPDQDERASCHSSGCIRGAMATGGAGLGLIQWSEKAWCFDACRGCVGVCDVRWSASTGWPSMRSCSDYHACRHGVISCVNALHVKPCFHCRVPFSMTWASATSMKMMRSLFSCPRHGTGNLYQLAWRTWPR